MFALIRKTGNASFTLYIRCDAKKYDYEKTASRPMKAVKLLCPINYSVKTIFKVLFDPGRYSFSF